MIRNRRIPPVLLAAICFVTVLGAQEDVLVQRSQSAPPVPPAPPAPAAPRVGFAALAQAPTFEFIAAQPVFMERTVTGAPYSAEAVSETTRVLADGTRIKNENSAKIYRDSEGRVRKEQAFGHIGFWVAEGGAPESLITITDPVAKKTIILNPNDKSARVMTMPPLPPTPPLPPAPPLPSSSPLPPSDETGNVNVQYRTEEKVVVTGEGNRVVQFREVRSADGAVLRSDIDASTVPGMPGAGPMVLPRRMQVQSAFDPKNVNVEQLGEQTVQGVKATGTRTTTTIPVGAIGNDRPIVSVLEQWTSPELGVVVMRTLRDPQIGETVYRLENINRAEPLKSLFEVPTGYEVKESQPRMQRMEFRKRSEGE